MRIPALTLSHWLLFAMAAPCAAHERQVEQLTLAFPSDTPGAAVDDFLPARAADRVVFETTARDLLPIGDRRYTLASLYRFDGATGKVSAIPVRTEADGEGNAVAIDPSGRWLLVESTRRIDLAEGGWVSPENSQNLGALFLIDMDTGTTHLVTRRADRPSEPAPNHIPHLDVSAEISSDGRYVHYTSNALLLDSEAPASTGWTLMYRFDRQTGQNKRVGFLDEFNYFTHATRAVWSDPSGEKAIFSSESLGLGLVDHVAGTTTRLSVPPQELVAVSDNGNHLLQCVMFGPGPRSPRHAQWTAIPMGGGTPTVLTPAPDGMIPAGACNLPGRISNDGRIVSTTELVSDATAFDRIEIAQWHLPERERVLVSRKHGTTSIPASGLSVITDADADGNYLAISSDSRELIGGLTGPQPRANYLWDRSNDRMTLVSAHSDHPQTPRDAFPGYFAGSGATLHFRSAAQLTTANDSNRQPDLYRYDRGRGANSLVSRRTSEVRRAPNRDATAPIISHNGQRIAFQSSADDLLPMQSGVDEAAYQIYAMSPGESLPTLVSARRGNPGLPAAGISRLIGLDATGRFLAFESTATDLNVPLEFTPSRFAPETFVTDLLDMTTTLVTRSPNGPLWSGQASGNAVAMSFDGAWILYAAGQPAPLLVEFDTAAPFGGSALLWLPTRPGLLPKLATHAHAFPNRGPDRLVEEIGHDPSLLWVAYRTKAGNLVSEPQEFTSDQLFVSNRIDDRTLWLTKSAMQPGVAAGGGIGFESRVIFSADGTSLLLTHSAGDLAPPFESGHETTDCFRVALATGVVSRVVPDGDPNRSRKCYAISADGRFVVYGDQGPNEDAMQLWRADSRTGALALVSASGTGEPANASAFDALASADGNRILFKSQASNLVDTQIEPQSPNILLRDIAEARTTLITDGAEPGTNPTNGFIQSISATPSFDRIAMALGGRDLRSDIAPGGANINIYLSSETRFAGNPGLSGLWGEPSREGQGFHLVSLPATDANGRGSMLLSWYTYQPAGATGTRTRQRWLLGLGTVENGVGTFAVSSADDGRFDEAAAGAQVPRGSVTIRFADCNRAEAQYAVTIDGQTRAGLIPLERITPDTACSSYRDRGPAALAEVPRIAGSSWQYGIGGAWHDPAKPGQGLLIEVMPQSNQVIATWFTFDAGQTLGNDRQPPLWLAAIGPVSGNRASLSTYESSGGTLDQAGGTTLTTSGTIELDVASCSRLMATYAITMGNTTRSGQIPLERITPDAGCEP